MKNHESPGLLTVTAFNNWDEFFKSKTFRLASRQLDATATPQSWWMNSSPSRAPCRVLMRVLGPRNSASQVTNQPTKRIALWLAISDYYCWLPYYNITIVAIVGPSCCPSSCSWLSYWLMNTNNGYICLHIAWWFLKVNDSYTVVNDDQYHPKI